MCPYGITGHNRLICKTKYSPISRIHKILPIESVGSKQHKGIGMFRLSVMICVMVLFAPGCKKEQSESDAKTSIEAANVLKFGFDTLDMGAVEAICANHSLMVYVGNAEAMGTYKYAPGVSDAQKKAHREAVNKSHAQYYKTVKDSLSDLQSALTVNRCDAYHDTKITLLGIVDGPTSGDSFISVTRYAFQNKEWKNTDPEYFKVVNGSLKNVPKSESLFEINMPKRVSQIISGFNKRYGPHTQINYFLKTHGGLVKTGKHKLPTLTEVTTKSGTALGDDVRHVLLFDANGENGPIRSPLYTYMWMKENACKIYEGARDSKAYDAAGCSSIAAASTQGGDGGPTQGGDGGPTQGGDGGPTQGADGGPTQGADGGPTQGADGGPTQGADGGPTQGADGGPTQGADGGPTQGGDGGPTQGVGAAGLQGPGKSLMYLSTQTPEPKLREDGDPNGSEPDILFMMGVVASYDMAEDAKMQLYDLKLEYPEETSDRPTFIVLDSCYGSDQVVKSAESNKSFDEALSSADKKSGKLKVCTMSNPKPTYSHTINYGLLDTSSYLAMPFLFHWGSHGDMPDSTDQIDPLALELGSVFMNPTSVDAEALREKYKKDGVDIKDIQTEYLKLKPVCFERE